MKNIAKPVLTRIRKHHTIIAYLFVGSLLFVIDFFVSLFMYYVVGTGPGISSGSGFMASFVVGFLLNKRVVFKHDANSRFNTSLQIVMYLSLATANLLISSFTVELIVNSGVRIEIVKPITVAVIACWNYLIFKFFIFSKKREAIN